MNTKERYDKIIAYFSETQSSAETELKFSTTFQLLIAVVLSAQCTDKRVNMVTSKLFNSYPTPQLLAEASETDIYEYIKSISYPNAKTKHIIALSKMLVENYDGEVPSDMNALMKLPGVGRKTANVIMAVAFTKNAMPVDTHVYRVSHRLGLVSKRHNTPYKVEQELIRHIPENMLAKAHHWLLLHGRYICKSAKPLCTECQFNDFCQKKLEGSKL